MIKAMKNAGRRHFLKTCGKGALLASLPLSTGLTGCTGGACKMKKLKENPPRYKTLVLKNGSVFINGRYVKTDMEVTEGVITRLGKADGRPSGADVQVIDCTRMYISPGWVDIHCHIGGVGVDLDILGPEMGVTALVDAGTYGPDTFSTFMEEHYVNTIIPVYVVLNVRKNGIEVSNIIFNSVKGVEDADGARELALARPDIIKGFKVRLDAMNTSGDNPAYLAEVAARLGEDMTLPVVYHLGNPPPFITDFLKTAKPADMFAHVLREKNNCILDKSGKIRPEVLEAKSNGVCFDVAHGVASFEFDTAKQALDQGFTDFTISSDLWLLPSWTRCRTFSNVASKFLALGLDIDDVTYKISSRPREMLNMASTIDVNTPIDLTVFSLREGEFEYSDTSGNELTYSKRIIPEYTIVGNMLIRAGMRDREIFDVS
jgi:dihydroorotase